MRGFFCNSCTGTAAVCFVVYRVGEPTRTAEATLEVYPSWSRRVTGTCQKFTVGFDRARGYLQGTRVPFLSPGIKTGTLVLGQSTLSKEDCTLMGQSGHATSRLRPGHLFFEAVLNEKSIGDYRNYLASPRVPKYRWQPWTLQRYLGLLCAHHNTISKITRNPKTFQAVSFY